MKKILTYSFCDNFLDKLANYLDENYLKKNKDISRLAICFAGRRPALFLRKELAQRIKANYFPPRFFTIDELISFSANKKESFSAINDLDNCYLLYKLAKRIAPHILRGRESFAQFLPWTREIASFIDQLDLENIADDSLRNIEANAQIGYDVPEDINVLLQTIVDLRSEYHKELNAQKKYSRGLQYLRAAEAVVHQDFDEFENIIFCNLFYLNKTEETFIKTLYEKDKATLIFQGDQRKWPVLERVARNFSVSLLEGKTCRVPQFKMNLFEGFDGHSQIGAVTEIFRKIKNPHNTVIVLPDPKHIVGLISEISSVTEDFNISMGYPLKRSSLYSLFEFMFKAQTSRRQGRYYTKNYLRVLKHPFVKNLKIGDLEISKILIYAIEEVLTGKEPASLSGSMFVDLKEVLSEKKIYEVAGERMEREGIRVDRENMISVVQAIHRLFFRDWEEIPHFKYFAETLESFLDTLIEGSFLSDYPLNLNIAKKMYAIKDEFKNSSFGHEAFRAEEIFRVFESKVAREIVPFIGSPLKGLQMLGLFETRSLNFENVIILDANEGVLPRLNIYEPLIPREVMISLNLDRLEMEEEIQRYQFMRLISSAKDVYFVYEKSKEKERSRFIEELIWEEQKKQGKLAMSPVLKTSFAMNVQEQKCSFKKTPEIMKVLASHKYSASSINTYLRNPVEFYYSYVLGLREKEDLLDEPQARQVGTFIHELLEAAFEPLVGKKPNIDEVFQKRFMALFDQKFSEAFGRGMKADSFLLRSVIEERMLRFLEHEMNAEARAVAEILHLEKRFEEVIPLPCGNIKFGYIVDRIDRMRDGTIMIIDYKTGSLNQMPKAIDRISSMALSRESIKEEVKSFQIPLYFHYLDKQYPDVPINAALYNLRTMKMDKFIDRKIPHSRKQINEAFLRPLNFILSEILNPDIDFIEDKNESRR